jgi:hypothetical protein
MLDFHDLSAGRATNDDANRAFRDPKLLCYEFDQGIVRCILNRSCSEF